MKNNSLFHVLNSTCCPFPQDHMVNLLELDTKNVDIVFHFWYIAGSVELPGSFLQELGTNAKLVLLLSGFLYYGVGVCNWKWNLGRILLNQFFSRNQPKKKESELVNESQKLIFGFPGTVLIIIFKSGLSSSGAVSLIQEKKKESKEEDSQGDYDTT